MGYCKHTRSGKKISNRIEDTCSTSKMHKVQQHHKNVLSKH